MAAFFAFRHTLRQIAWSGLASSKTQNIRFLVCNRGHLQRDGKQLWRKKPSLNQTDLASKIVKKWSNFFGEKIQQEFCIKLSNILIEFFTEIKFNLANKDYFFFL